MKFWHSLPKFHFGTPFHASIMTLKIRLTETYKMNNKHITIALSVFFLFISISGSEGRESDPGQLIATGKEYYQNGDFEHAALSWEQAVKSVDPEKETGIYLDALVHLAETYQALGYHHKALVLFNSAMPIVGRSTDKYRNAQFFRSLGDIHLSFGNLDKADEYLVKALEQARLANDPRVLTSVLTDAGNLLATDGDYEGALGAYTECLDLADKIPGKPELKTKALINILYVAYLDGNDEIIEPALDAALAETGSLPDSSGKAEDLIFLSLIIRTILNDPELETSPEYKKYLTNAALKTLYEAKRIAETLKDPRVVSYAYGYLGQLYEIENRISDALKLTRTAVFFAEQGNFPQIQYLWQWQMGRLFKAQGEIEKAVKAYKKAVSTLNPIRGELFRGLRLQQDILNDQIKPVYLGLAELLLDLAEKDSDKSAVHIREARDTMELLKTAELEDFFQDECITLMKSKERLLDSAPAHTALIYPIVLPDNLAIILTLPDGMEQIRVPVDSETLEETVIAYRKLLQNRMNKRFLYFANLLYNWIIKPLEEKLTAQEINTLVIAPDGVLRLVPLSTLYNGKQYLVEKYAIAIVPAVTLTDPRPFQKDNVSILLSGLSEARQGFSPLPSVTSELADIKKIMNGRIVLKNEDFNVANLTDEFKNNEYSIVHMATHGIFGGTPRESFLLNYNDRLTMDGLEQLISMGRFRDRPVELLTLSACQTALGNERAALGLAGVAVKAGVRSAIATLWYVDDEATSLAIREFYRQLKTPGISKAQALQNTQKKLIADQRYWHPLYWAPFLLIGNWM
ncbi:MAG: CHAT domain-containing protein [Desulfobacterales bacterium]|nr:CHAT domain-containing protein [Desulfobacterales bacterium]